MLMSPSNKPNQQYVVFTEIQLMSILITILVSGVFTLISIISPKDDILELSGRTITKERIGFRIFLLESSINA